MSEQPIYEDPPLQDPSNVVRDANLGWAIWEPGDWTRYYVSVIPFTTGPCAGDKIVIVTTVRSTATFRIGVADVAEAEVRRTMTISDTQGYDWWPKVLRPLAKALGMREERDAG